MQDLRLEELPHKLRADNCLSNLRWRPAVGYEEFFLISSCGKVYSLRTYKRLKTVVHQNGYEIFSSRLYGRNSKSLCFKVHRLVAMSFLTGRSKIRNFVNHKDLNKLNNDISNLEWCSPGENIKHAYDNNAMVPKYGTESYAGKISKDLLSSVVKALEDNNWKASREIARRLNIPWSTLCDIYRNKTYVKEVAELRSKYQQHRKVMV